MAQNYNLQQNIVYQPGRNEVIRQSLYDYQVYPTAGFTQLQFFQLPIGQGICSQNGALATNAKGIGDTNLRMAGTIPAGNRFRIETIELPFFAGAISTANRWAPAVINSFAAVAAATVGAASDDVQAFYSSGHLQLFILSKPYLDEAPLGRFPPKTNLRVSAAVASNSAPTGEVIVTTASMGGRPYVLKPEITLTPVMNFAVNLDWIVAVATPSGFNARVGCILDGILERAAQ